MRGNALVTIGFLLGLTGIGAGIVAQVVDNSVHGNNPLLLAGAIVLSASILAEALSARSVN